MFINDMYLREANSMCSLLNICVLFHYLTLCDAGLVLGWKAEENLTLISVLWQSAALTSLREETFCKDHWSQQGYHSNMLGLSSWPLICEGCFYYLSLLTEVKLTVVCSAHRSFQWSINIYRAFLFSVCSCHLFLNSICFSVWLLVFRGTIWVVPAEQEKKLSVFLIFSLLVLNFFRKCLEYINICHVWEVEKNLQVRFYPRQTLCESHINKSSFLNVCLPDGNLSLKSVQ